MHERPCRADRRRLAVEAEAFESARFQLVEQRPPRRLRVEGPGVDRRHRQPGIGQLRPGRGRRLLGAGDVEQAEIARHEHFTRAQHHQFIGEGLHAVGAHVLGGGELAG